MTLTEWMLAHLPSEVIEDNAAPGLAELIDRQLKESA